MDTARIEWAAKATRQLLKLDRQAQKQIVAAVGNELPAFRRSPQVVSLVRHRYGFRLRVGNYRVLFDADESGVATIVRIEEVRKRNERTY